jgi:hypothetical protein
MFNWRLTAAHRPRELLGQAEQAFQLQILFAQPLFRLSQGLLGGAAFRVSVHLDNGAEGTAGCIEKRTAGAEPSP